MKVLFTAKAISAMVLGVVCALMAGCGAGSIPFLNAGTVSGTQNPLVALYTLKTECVGQAMVEFGTTTNYGRNTAWYPVNGYKQSTSILVAGMLASTTYHMRSDVQCSTGNGATAISPDITFTTGPLPSSVVFPKLTVSRPNPSLSLTENPGIESIDVTVPPTPALFADRDGNPIWYYDVGQGNFAFPFKLLPDGNILLSITEFTSGLGSVLREVDLAGNTIREMTIDALGQKMTSAGYDFVPGGFHHDFATLPNGHVIAIVDCSKWFTNLPGYPGKLQVIGDGLVDLDQNWNPVWAWNSFDHLDVNRHVDGLPDWTHSNAILYSPADGNLILSMRNQSWVLKIDYNNGGGTGSVLWHLGYQGDFALTDGGTVSDDPSLWFANQHFPIILSQSGPQLALAVWDNGDNRILTASGAECVNSLAGTSAPPCYSRPVIFQLDESSMVANIAWADQLPYYSIWGGSINQFANGNVEFDLNDPAIPPSPNVASQVQEVTGTSTPEVVWQMDVTPITLDAYRAYRVPSLYNGVTWPF
jgi:arylsulfate sulfotransferase